MAKKVVMPKLAMAMNEGIITSWMFEEGDQVTKGEILLEIETEKVSYEIEATGDGLLHIEVTAGETVPVETLIGYLAEDAEEFASLAGGAEPAVSHGEPAAEMVVANQEVASVATATKHAGRIIASPLARKMAKQNGLDLSQVTGSGSNGRIVKRDILAALEAPQVAPVAAAAAPAAPSVDASGLKVKTVLPFKGVRKAISENMQASLNGSAQMSLSFEVDASALKQLRASLVNKAEKIGVKVTFTDLFALVVARAAAQVPIVNAALVGEEIKVWDDINLGVAIATEISEYETGLYVPVIKDAGRKSLFTICSELKDLIWKAKEGTLSSDEMSGGTITLSSASFLGGMLGTTPILSPGQAMLIQPGPIEEKPVVRDGEIVARPMMVFSLTFDHRIVDGVPAGKFAGKIRELIEDPELLL
jgi:pyruvate dehydrogenase E2 component (dihydrolipoamide acetyltransferase)/2-oxoglutarate dehydrogenase E2 component (dihydrolipoamide succinyltransferase)